MSSTRVTDLKQIASRYGYRVTQIRSLDNPEWFFVLDGKPVEKASPEFLMRGQVAERSVEQWEREVRRRANGEVEKICLKCAKQQGMREERVGKLLPMVFVAGRRVRQRGLAGESCICSYCRQPAGQVFEFADG